MTMDRRWLFVFLFSLGFLSEDASTPGFCQSDPLAPAVVFKEANEKWALYQSTYLPKLQGSVRGGRIGETAVSKWEFKNTPDSSVYTVDGFWQDVHRLEACAANPQYSFSLKKRDGKGWVLDQLSLDPSDRVAPMGRPVREVLFQVAAAQFMVSGKVPLPELVNHPSFSIRSVKNVTSAEGLAVVRVEFGFKPYLKKESQLYVPVESGTMVLVPAQFWRILTCDVNEKYGDSDGNFKAAYEVGVKDGGVPILKKSLVKRQGLDNGKIREEEYVSECDLRFAEGTSEGDFYLTAFGLPEPVGITAPSSLSRWYIWIGLAGWVALGVGILARLYIRRIQAREPGKKA